MKKFLLLSILVFFVTNLSFAQSGPIYFNNTLIIKYESSNQLQKTNSQSIGDIQQQVTDYLSSFGLTKVKPLLGQSMENQLQRTLSAKQKSIRAENISEDLRRIFEYSFTSEIDPMILARKISNMPGIEYAEPRFIRMTNLVPNDPLNNDFPTVHKFHEAWDISTGSPDIIIGIVDSGVNYFNQDLKNKGWVNEDEIPDNGIDDDENGFIDDHIGWDFWHSGTTIFSLTSDNDPFAGYSDHGSHVAGLATAETNNGRGIAGAGYNSRYMAIKAGGIEDDPSSEIDESRLIGFGYDGILYGVLNGADIINNSWGGEGVSNTEQEVIDLALNAGVVIIAAQGNENTTILQSPASYDGVLGVGSITGNLERSSFSNYGYSVDVFATGSGVVSSAGFDSTTYLSKSGTSMSSPIVAGLAGLIKAEYPDWSPRRIIHQIKSTAVPFNTVLDPLLLGKGMIDAEAALTNLMPGISIRSYNISDSEGNSLSVGESGVVEVKIKNFGETTAGLTVSLEAIQENITITKATENIGVLATDDSINVILEFDIPEDYDLSNPPTFVFRYEDTSLDFDDFEVVQFDNLNFGVMTGNNIMMSFGANGTIGFSDPSEATGGIGFIPSGFGNILYEGGIIMMAGGNPFLNEAPKLSNNVRNNFSYDTDFDPDIAFAVNVPGETATAEGSGSFLPNGFAELEEINVELNTFAFEDPDIENVIYTQYKITNTSDEVLKDYYMGVFTDWDVNNFRNNTVLYDPNNDFMYIYDATADNGYPFVTVVTLQAASAHLAIDNGYEGNESDFRFQLYDGYSDQEKINSLRAANNVTGASGADVSTVVASGPYEFNPGVTINIGFMYVYGSNYPDLRDKVLAARDRFVFNVDEPGVYTPNEIENDLPLRTSLQQNYPNPFNPSTEINFDLAETGFTQISVYNILGRKVQSLVNEVKTAGSYSIHFDASQLNSGIYFAVLNSGDVSQTIKMMLIK